MTYNEHTRTSILIYPESKPVYSPLTETVSSWKEFTEGFKFIYPEEPQEKSTKYFRVMHQHALLCPDFEIISCEGNKPFK